jgi:hypothetical protein
VPGSAVTRAPLASRSEREIVEQAHRVGRPIGTSSREDDSAVPAKIYVQCRDRGAANRTNILMVNSPIAVTARRPRARSAARRTVSFSSPLRERAPEVFEQVLRTLEPDGHADQPVRDPLLATFVDGETAPAMRGRGSPA